MDAKHFALYDGADGEIVEGLSEVLPDISVAILPFDLLEKPVVNSHFFALVIAPE